MKCFLERRHAASSRNPANDKQQSGETGRQPAGGHFEVGAERKRRRDISILAFTETGPRNRSAECSNTSHTSD